MNDQQLLPENRPARRRLGKTGIEVSPVAMGCWPIAGMTSLGVNDADSVATLHAAIDAGVNFFDNAYGYGSNGESELLLGQALRELRQRSPAQWQEIVVASKAGMHWEANGQRKFDASPPRIVSQCEESLQRLGIDRIDVYYLHARDPKIPLEDSANAFAGLLEQGKIGCVGVSNLSVAEMETFASACPISVVQPPFNMLQQQIQGDLIPWCQERDVAVVSYWPLMKGLLAGGIRRGHAFERDDKRLTYDIFQGAAFEKAQLLLDFLDGIAAKHNVTVAEVVVNWTFNQPGICVCLCGAKRDWQIRQSAAAMDLQLDQDDLKCIDQKLAELQML